MKKLIHIPHSSTKIPKMFLSDYLISGDELVDESILMCDIYTDKLIEKSKDVEIIKFKYSRLFCDVERFETDEMDEVGMGILYTNTHDLNPMRVLKNEKEILKYYYTHHNKLNNLTEEILEQDGEIFIIDLHSYSNKPLKYELHKNLKRPDVCLGVDSFHMDEKLLEKIIYIFNEHKINFIINEPFEGCLIPSNYYLKDKRVKGIMVEINKKMFKNDLEKIKELLICLIKEI